LLQRGGPFPKNGRVASTQWCSARGEKKPSEGAEVAGEKKRRPFGDFQIVREGERSGQNRPPSGEGKRGAREREDMTQQRHPKVRGKKGTKMKRSKTPGPISDQNVRLWGARRGGAVKCPKPAPAGGHLLPGQRLSEKDLHTGADGTPSKSKKKNDQRRLGRRNPWRGEIAKEKSRK